MTEDDFALLDKLWLSPLSIKQIARKMGYSPNTIATAIQNNRKRYPLRRRNFSQDERDMWADRVPSGELGVYEAARMARVNPQTIYKWKWERRAARDSDRKG